MRTAFLVSALAFVVPALSAPTIIPLPTFKCTGPVNPGSYIIKLKDDVLKDIVLPKLLGKLGLTNSAITHDYFPFMPAIAAKLQPQQLALVHLVPEVEYVEPDMILSLKEHQQGDTSLDVSHPVVADHRDVLGRRNGGTSGEGEGVMIYDIDTGIYTEHKCFGGRATFGANFADTVNTDENGHGTHTAGTAACKEYNGAGSASITAVKVLGKDGSGALSGVMAGVQWVVGDCQGKKCIATMSLGASDPACQSTMLDDAVRSAIKRNVHFTIAAGNDGLDASMTTPARVEEANTIGAVDSSKNNETASFSNHGKLIDVWAPGVNIKSAWIGKPDAENTISGTSMATPYVAGILAVALGEYGQMSPNDLNKALKAHATPDVKLLLTAKLSGSNNLLVQKW